MRILNVFRPNWKHSDPQVRCRAVEHIIERGTLEFILESNAPTDARRIAANRLFSDKHVRSHARRSVREAAVHVLVDETILEEIAEHDSNPNICAVARRKLDGTWAMGAAQVGDSSGSSSAQPSSNDLIYAKHWAGHSRQWRAWWKLGGLFVLWNVLNGLLFLPLGVPTSVGFAISCLIMAVLFFWNLAITMFICPGCGNSFYLNLDFAFRSFERRLQRRCVHCGLRFGDDPTAVTNEEQRQE